MGEWGSALLFGVFVAAFVIGASSLIMSFIPEPEGAPAKSMHEKIEYVFFGITGLIVSVMLLLALVW